jgi:transcriptional regulator with XRE-family HTH domain
MGSFRKLLREARKRAGLSQPKLAKKVAVDKSYISKLETGVFPPPSRDVVLKLVDALGINEKVRRLVFLLAAYVAGEEDVQGFKLVKVEEDDAEPEEEEEQGSSAATYSGINTALAIPDSLLGTLGNQIEEIKHVIDSMSFTDDQEEVVASHLDTLKRLLKFIAAQSEMRKEG